MKIKELREKVLQWLIEVNDYDDEGDFEIASASLIEIANDAFFFGK